MFHMQGRMVNNTEMSVPAQLVHGPKYSLGSNPPPSCQTIATICSKKLFQSLQLENQLPLELYKGQARQTCKKYFTGTLCPDQTQ